ncbi:MAG: pyridoxal phosphate-dependent aminotransferase [Candidatus Andersenbacteria bacterium]|nr:pyridoxal phosphate-dependent aminotransferase [bacterium]MDZ4225515.1 pyridoxal phosphate-dependent aminotransferase [Candidatus Andersenbacteria bacterium]
MSSESPTIRTLAAEAVARGAVDLSQGVVHATPPKVLFDLFGKLSDDQLVNGYGPSQGDPLFLRAVLEIVQGENKAVEQENLLATIGVIGGIFSALESYCEPGDAVLMLEPCFPGYPWVVEAAGLKPVYVPHQKDGWGVDWVDFENKAKTAKAVLVASPGNPSGYLWKKDELEKLLVVAAKYNLLVIADEIYDRFIWEGEFVSLMDEAIEDSRIVVLRGFSKSLAMAGWRVGWAVATPDRIAAMQKVHDKVCPGGVSPLQRVVGMGWLEKASELRAFTAKLTAQARMSRLALADIFKKLGMEPIMPDGAIYMMVRHNRNDDMAAMRELLDKGVAVTPGRIFYGDGKKGTDFIRAHFALTDEDLRKVKERLLG